MPRRPPLLLIFAVTVTGIMSNSLMSPAVPDILDEFGRSDSASGILVASGSLPGIVAAPMIGVLADRFGRKAVLVPCLVDFGVFGIVAATAQSFEVLLGARFIMGFGSAGLINLAVVMIGDSWSGAERTAMIGRNAAVLTAGLAVMPLLSGLLTDLASWRVAMGLYPVSLITAAVVMWRLDNHRPAQAGNVAAQLRESVGLLRTPVMLTSMLGGALSFAVMFGVFLTAMPVHLEDEFGLSAGWRGVMLAIPAASTTVVAFNLARLRRSMGLRRLLSTGAALFAAAFFLMGLTPVLALMVVAVIGYGLGEGALIPSLQDVAASVAPDHLRGGAMAAWVGAARLGQTAGPLAATATIGLWGTGATMIAGGVVALGVTALKLFGPLDDEALEAARP